MKLINIIKRFDFWQLISLSWLMIRKPLRIIPVLKATQRTMVICDKYYPGVHHQNGPANAFRHALWNVLICQKVFALTEDVEVSRIWAKKVASLHEKLAPNSPLATAMDLHNNEIGRNYFDSLMHDNEIDVILFLQEKLSNIKLISDVSQINLCPKEMVCIER